jgi:hypothetical protein
VPEIIDPVFAKTNQNARFLLSENERFGLVFVKTGSINSGTVVSASATEPCCNIPKSDGILAVAGFIRYMIVFAFAIIGFPDVDAFCCYWHPWRGFLLLLAFLVLLASLLLLAFFLPA